MRNITYMLFAVLLAFGLMGCEKIEVGNVGIKINTVGDVRGVENSPTVSGWVSYNPFTQDVVEFPTTTQTVNYTADADGGSTPINFGTKEGMTVSSDVSVSFRIEPTLVPRLYARFKQENLEVLEHTFLQRMVRDALNETGAHMSVYDVYGAGKTDLLTKSKEFLQKKVGDDGFVIEELTFSGPLRLPPNIQASIDSAIKATQDAQVAQNMVKQYEAQAAQKKAQADGEAQKLRTEAQAASDSAKLRAEGEAQAILVKAEAQAKANELLQKSIGRELIELEKVKRWDGKIPVNLGSGNGMIIDMRTAQQLGAQ